MERRLCSWEIRRVDNILYQIQKKPLHKQGFKYIERRKRDSNPRRYDPQQFLRLPHSTTLPFLQMQMQIYTILGIKKYFNLR